jgi:flagellar motility protein MotE (MotC chaperone)
VLRGRILAQLLGIRGQLDSVPAMLASVNRESELLDAQPDAAASKSEQRSNESKNAKSAPAAADRKNAPNESEKKSEGESDNSDEDTAVLTTVEKNTATRPADQRTVKTGS